MVRGVVTFAGRQARKRRILLLSLLPTASFLLCKRSLRLDANSGIKLEAAVEVADGGTSQDRRFLVQSATPSAVMIFEAEEYSDKDDADFETSEGGYSGWGYMDYANDGYLEWNNVTAFLGVGEYNLSVRYAVDDRRGRECRVFVNDMEEEVAVLDFADTDGYGKWQFDNVTVPLQAGNNTVRIEARNNGPHVDKMEVTLVSLYTPSPTSTPTATPSAAPTTSAAPSSSPTVSSQPSLSLAPSSSPSVSPTSEMEVRPFQLKMFFEEGMKWQGERTQRAWCAECKSSCKAGREVDIEECNENEKYQRWYYEDGLIRSAVKRDMCVEAKLPRYKRVRMEDCDESNENQIFVGFQPVGKFQIKPIRFQTECLTQGHHPRGGEYLYLIDCNESLVGDGSLTSPYDDTSHWIIGRWSGHSDDGELYREDATPRTP